MRPNTLVNQSYRLLCLVGARPNFMKIAPIIAALAEVSPNMDVRLLHTGQHYDATMNHQYFEALGIPAPDINLEVGSGSHAVQTAEVMRRFEPALDEQKPDAVLVVGDVNSTLACALVAAKKGVPVIHVEAGLRSFDRRMAEEINRVLTDQIADLLFTTEREGRNNLLREGIAEERIHFVGNVMIDTLRRNLDRAVPATTIIRQSGAVDFPEVADGYAVFTLHRASNVDNPQILDGLMKTVATVSKTLPVIFPMHPRTRSTAERYGLLGLLDSPRILLLPPMGYLEMLGLTRDARVVLTDSGGIQEETTALGVPCITIRENTERPITVTEGSNTIAGVDPDNILQIFDDVMRTGGKSGRIPEFWDGKAAYRIAQVIHNWIGSTSAPEPVSKSV
ncbi:MAG TPA: UDP-N-acetylglucosamine 2-epimerase (non-hydrolyzing) [Noviherbaspirillum sp.]|nr:UDP-N-acetylglucosamine 2-epimerase (non-hydrolyzing) [Noviherbaspirillum sp.]